MDLQVFPSTASANWRYQRRSAWMLSIGMAMIGIATLVGLFWDTVTSAVRLWWNIPTYNYAFLVLPISAYLIWRKRDEVRAEVPIGSLWGVATVAGFGLVWLLSDIAEITEGRHLAFVGMVLGILLACLGWRVFKILSVPFLYLLLLVPTGTVALPLLQKIATLISSSIIQTVGIPVYTDGFFIEVPSGRYHVEPGCAGLNLILASAALAPLYAYLLYHSFWKRFVVVAIALILAVITNGLRIAGIISISHWGGPRISIVDDHLFFGWALFASVLFLAGYVGCHFADREPTASTNEKGLPFRRESSTRWHTVMAGVLSLLIVASVFVVAEGARSSSAALVAYSSPTRVDIPGWRNIKAADWFPAFTNADLQIQQSYARNGHSVDLFIAAYSQQSRGHKMIAYDNRVIDETRWSVLRQNRRTIGVSARTLPIIELVAASGDQRRHIWLFYWIDGTFTANPLVAKLLEVKVKLFSGDQRAAVVAITTPPTTDGSDDIALQSFLQDALQPIEVALKTPASPVQTLPLERH
jgi:exosortase A